MARVGFIGVGNMGAPMARNLIKAGHTLKVFDLNEEAVNFVVQSRVLSPRVLSPRVQSPRVQATGASWRRPLSPRTQCDRWHPQAEGPRRVAGDCASATER